MQENDQTTKIVDLGSGLYEVPGVLQVFPDGTNYTTGPIVVNVKARSIVYPSSECESKYVIATMQSIPDIIATLEVMARGIREGKPTNYELLADNLSAVRAQFSQAYELLHKLQEI